MNHLTANTEDESRPDIKARGFWQTGQVAFFDVRVTYVNSESQKDQSTQDIFHAHEQAKKREYLQRIVDIKNGSFSPLIFGTNGGIGKECSIFLSSLANKLAEKKNEDYTASMTWLRTRLSFEIMRSAVVCIRGSRKPFRICDTEVNNFHLLNAESGV